jgi:hypothetical protein
MESPAKNNNKQFREREPRSSREKWGSIKESMRQEKADHQLG